MSATADPVTLFLDAGNYADPGHLQDVIRSPLPCGEAVRFLLAWGDNGAPLAAHQVHLFDLSDGVITHHHLRCGGTWDAALQAEIDAGLQSAREAR